VQPLFRSRAARSELRDSSEIRYGSGGGPSAGQRLAAATGARLAREVGSPMETLEFPSPAAARAAGSQPAAGSVWRAPAPVAASAPDPGASPDPSSSPGVSTPPDPGGSADAAGQGSDAPGSGAPPPGPAAGGSHAAASPETDDLYEHIIERLRRDLLSERERMGDLLGDLP
jgi:hypothetical protein